MLNPEFVEVIAGGFAYSGWKTVTVSAAINEAARSFHLGTTEHLGEWAFPPGTPVDILANGDLMVRGYVNAYVASGEKKAHDISIQGRSKAQDFIDSSAEHETGDFENQTPAQAAQALDKFDVGVEADVPLDAEPYMKLYEGESPFQFTERWLRPQGATMMGAPEGNIRITNAQAAKSHYGILMEGQNILSFQVDLNDGSRHSVYGVKGQARHGTGAASLRIHQTATDGGVGRHRPKTIVSETDTDDKRAAKRAHHEKERAAGKCIQASVQTQGFRDFAGELFAPNRLIYVHAPILMHLSMAMLIERVQFTQDKAGSKTQLTLVDPRAYKGAGPGKGAAANGAETDSAWTGGY